LRAHGFRRPPAPLPSDDRHSAAPHAVHLDRLEAESIHILREVAASFANPVMLYSVGKDSSVLLHLLLKAFAPADRRSRCCTWTRAGSSAR
jgi:sulfate adenylyltransferase subunit 2